MDPQGELYSGCSPGRGLNEECCDVSLIVSRFRMRGVSLVGEFDEALQLPPSTQHGLTCWWSGHNNMRF